MNSYLTGLANAPPERVAIHRRPNEWACEESAVDDRAVEENPGQGDRERPVESAGDGDHHADEVGAMAADGRATVLVVEDEPQMLELFRQYLDDDYAVRTATNGEQAIEQFDETVDVVLLDRRMPGRSGDEVLDELRDRGFDGPVAMVSAVDPGPTIADLPVDDYLVKPVSRADLTTLVATMLRRASLDRATRDYLATVTKIAILEATHSAAELEELAEYRELTERVDALRDRAEGSLPGRDREALDRLVRDID